MNVVNQIVQQLNQKSYIGMLYPLKKTIQKILFCKSTDW